ncbi:hypothetical protein OOU_Y34scaffold00152g3 [Pyricularia oryzae Y34]|uniref:Uncharacterized protein n=1 Tax=Pyricularia oryzae (strain Y34) TaxID=1143189 RepID=A0AA97PQQ6_PYRO3|nr:hypothetical protein OOU_Y34scaffold00152g3 [Pyricularia oryzae Y34]
MLVVGREIQLHVATVKGLDYSCSVATEIPSKLLSGVIRRKDDNKRTGKFKLNFGLQRSIRSDGSSSCSSPGEHLESKN